MISQRIQEEDLFTVIDTFMMPYGTECDLYQIMGEIKNVESAVNEYTDEKLYFMTLSCNDMIFDICINQKDLLGRAGGRQTVQRKHLDAGPHKF